MSISVVADVLDELYIEYTKVNGLIKVQNTRYNYVIAYDDEESKYDIYTYDENENRIGALGFTMSMFPLHFMHKKLYFKTWFNGVKEVITHYYMEKD